MSLADVFNTLPGSPVASGIIGLVVAVVVLYLARGPAHKALYSLSRGFQECFRLIAEAVLRGAESMEKRNKEVLMTSGVEAAERVIEREFERVEVGKTALPPNERRTPITAVWDVNVFVFHKWVSPCPLKLFTILFDIQDNFNQVFGDPENLT